MGLISEVWTNLAPPERVTIENPVVGPFQDSLAVRTALTSSPCGLV